MFKSDFKGLANCVGPPYVYIFFFSVPVPWSDKYVLILDLIYEIGTYTYFLAVENNA